MQIHASVQDDLAATCGQVVLPSGEVVLFDLADQLLIDQYVWHVSHGPHTDYAYGYRVGRAPSLGRVVVPMHHLFLQPENGLDVDHRDGNGLNNRRGNLRLATRSQNNGNARTPRHNTSGYKGVTFHRYTGKWRAYINLGRRQRHLGLFTDPWAAAEAYNAAAVAQWGEFARVNRRSA